MRGAGGFRSHWPDDRHCGGSQPALKGGKDSKGADPAIVKKWCQFYSEELLPQTKGLMKRTTPELDAFGMFLPSRMGASVSGELLQKGLQGGDEGGRRGPDRRGEGS